MCEFYVNMHVKIFILIFQFVYLNQYYFLNSEALVGPNVRNAGANEFPFIVSIGTIVPRDAEQGVGWENHICTGSLISRNHVLTAAHCVKAKDLRALQVSIGSVDLGDAEKFPVSWWLTFDDWVRIRQLQGPILGSDIAVIKLARNVNNLRIVPATLSPLNSFTTTGLSFNVAGWGRAEDDRTPRYLRTLRVNAISLMKCSQNLSIGKDRFIVVPFIYICTQASPPSFTTCGDSGGPIFNDNHEIIGINDAECNLDLNDEDKMNLHLCIDVYRDFIADAMR